MNAGNTWTSASGGDLSAGYARHSGTLRGALRQALVARALRVHLPAAPQRVLDIGGGDAHQAVQLARAGHQVTVLDTDPQMLQRARERLAGEPEPVRQRIHLVQGAGEDAVDLVGGGHDVVCCHGVLMYVQDPRPLVQAAVKAARPGGGLVSLLTKNATALAMRPALERRWADALAVMDAATEIGNLGVATRADSLEALQALLAGAGAGAATVAWYGVRVFTDHLGDEPVGEGFDQVLEAEWEAGRRDPYRRVGRQIHVIARTGTAGTR
ncbi:methyltransferase domain-containing protein [Spongiactinospora sp. 9N601]|uniref:methyltransferase domain-containing protein n=1 Tax=Spongiactinospora sp. 9N601 TaxID=3375149 RepID=UPI0037B14D11